MELATILVPIFAFVIVKMVLEQRAKARTDNVRLLEEALKNPALDRATIESLTFQLTGHRAPRGGGTTPFFAMLLAIGWIALFTGIGLFAIGAMTHDKDLAAAGVITGIIGFGLVTYPFALRELEARRQTQ